MMRIVAFVAILITVRSNALERNKVLEESKGAHINTIDLLLRQERGSAVNGNENLSPPKKAAVGLKDVQDEFEEENEIDESDLNEEDESDGFKEYIDEEGGSDFDDIQDNSNKEDDSESESIDDFEREHLLGISSESSLSQLNDMLNKADPGLAEEASKRNFEENDMIDGDIKLDEESAAELVDFYKRNPQYLSLDDNVTSASAHGGCDRSAEDAYSSMAPGSAFAFVGGAAVRKAIKIWERETCVRFKEKKSLLLAPPRIIFRGNMKGCWAFIGRRLLGNTVNLGKGCRNVGIALHEIGHALGFYHEQSRPDRGKYVIIKKGNIQFGKKRNFFIRPSRTYGTKYDYGSVMHYRDTAFAKRSGLKTIIAKQPNYEKTMGQRNYLSFYDIKAANFHYCQKRCKGGLRWSKCKHGGYRNPKKCGRCKCLDGWTGRYCTYPSYSKPLSTSCGNRYRSATASYQSLNSPGYPSTDYTPAAECTWRIRAPVGKRVRLFFSGTFRLPCYNQCLDFVEVRYKSLSVTGPRFCCTTRPTGVFTSTGRVMQVLFRTFSRHSRKGFRAYYKYV